MENTFFGYILITLFFTLVFIMAAAITGSLYIVSVAAMVYLALIGMFLLTARE
jgi:hypothetical protein